MLLAQPVVRLITVHPEGRDIHQDLGFIPSKGSFAIQHLRTHHPKSFNLRQFFANLACTADERIQQALAVEGIVASGSIQGGKDGN